MWQTERKGVLIFPVLVLLTLGLSAIPVTAVPQTAANWYDNGVSYTNQGRYDGAIYAFDQAIALNPDYARAYFTKGQVLAAIGKHSEAIGAYEMAIARDPGLAAAVENYLVTSVNVVYPDVPSGSLITGYWVSGWNYLEINNQQGTSDLVVALAPIGTDSATTAVYVKKGYSHMLEGIVPPGSYVVYITYGERWNGPEKRFDKNAGYLRWEFPQYTFGALGYGYSMTFIPQTYYPNWFIYNLDPIPETEFPNLS
jgi:tetratricopeptide (TPR) repeat protein